MQVLQGVRPWVWLTQQFQQQVLLPATTLSSCIPLCLWPHSESGFNHSQKEVRKNLWKNHTDKHTVTPTMGKCKGSRLVGVPGSLYSQRTQWARIPAVFKVGPPLWLGPLPRPLDWDFSTVNLFGKGEGGRDLGSRGGVPACGFLGLWGSGNAVSRDPSRAGTPRLCWHLAKTGFPAIAMHWRLCRDSGSLGLTAGSHNGRLTNLKSEYQIGYLEVVLWQNLWGPNQVHTVLRCEWGGSWALAAQNYSWKLNNQTGKQHIHAFLFWNQEVFAKTTSIPFAMPSPSVKRSNM